MEGDFEKDDSHLIKEELLFKPEEIEKVDAGIAGLVSYLKFSDKQKKIITSTITGTVRLGLPFITGAFFLYLLGIDVNYFVLYFFH